MAKVKVIHSQSLNTDEVLTDYGKDYNRFLNKPQNINSPEETNQFHPKVRYTTSTAVKGPIALINYKHSAIGKYQQDLKRIRRKHHYIEERKIRDPVIAHTPEGKRIFAYNDQGIPICFSKLSPSGRERTGHDRCHSIATLLNGRCKTHGGHAHAGVMHWNAKHLRNGDALPKHLQNDLRRAERDPDLLNLDHEIHLTDLRINQLEQDLQFSRSETCLHQMDSALKAMTVLIQKNKQIPQSMMIELIGVWVKGKDIKATNREISLAVEVRRKLVDSAAKRQSDLNLMMKADQAIALVTSMAACARECVSRLISNIEKRYYFLKKEDLTPDLEKFLMSERIRVSSLLEPSYKLEFLTDIGIKTRKMTTGKSRPETLDINNNEEQDE